VHKFSLARPDRHTGAARAHRGPAGTAAARTLFNRLGQPHELAAACPFLLSPLSTFITESVMRVTGGSAP
jgi:NAD(P)-dependent dehydrogenase (short-subunit alcohol dehydrogenase family)